MTREEAIAFFEDMNECTYGNLEAVEMAISALSGGEYIKKSELLQHVTTEVLSDYQECDVIHAEEIDKLTTYSFPDSADDNTMDIYSDLLRVKHGTMSIDSLIDKVWCGRKAVKYER